MAALRYTFLAFKVLGCLPSNTWTTTAKRTLYRMYSILIFVLVQWFTLTAILDIVFNVKNLAEFCDNFYITVVVIISIYKMLNFMGKREDIMFLINKMEREPFTPTNEEEMSIKIKIDKKIQNNSLAFLLVLTSYVILVWGTSLSKDVKVRQLSNQRVWVPYDYSSLALYIVTYCHQAISLTALSVVHYANDTLISGLMIFIRGQLKLLQHRLQNITGEHQTVSVKVCARHHEKIYRFAADVNDHFQGVLGFQFMATTPMACLALVRITAMDMGLQLYESAIYITCTLVQLSYYCWYGNEVKLKSIEIPDTIFESNWPDLYNSSKKILLSIMQRATSPIEFSSAHIVPVDLNTFMAVLKTSYSIFNLLHVSINTR